MTWYEADAYLTGMEENEKISWEQTRLIMYAVTQCNSKKKLSPKDVLKLPWDNEKTTSEEIDWAEVARMREEIRLEEKRMKQQLKTDDDD